jgi:hypothetical protein
MAAAFLTLKEAPPLTDGCSHEAIKTRRYPSDKA